MFLPKPDYEKDLLIAKRLREIAADLRHKIERFDCASDPSGPFDQDGEQVGMGVTYHEDILKLDAIAGKIEEFCDDIELMVEKSRRPTPKGEGDADGS